MSTNKMRNVLPIRRMNATDRAPQGVVAVSAVYNPEADTMAEIERLELEAREVRRRIEQARNDEDKRVLARQLNEIEQQANALRQRLP
jgi:hypothetical protein